MSKIKSFISNHKQDTQTIGVYCLFTLFAAIYALIVRI